MFRSLRFLCLLLPLTAVNAAALDTPTYSDRDSTYTSYQSQVATLYRNIIDGTGQAYAAYDTYTDYYGQTQTVPTNVSTRILVNDASYVNSDVNRRIDRTINIGRYSLRELPAAYADNVNTANYSTNAVLARNTDFGGYLPIDCTDNPACQNVLWIKQTAYTLHALIGDNADTVSCPINRDLTVPESVIDITTLLWIKTLLPTENSNCLFEANNSKFYNASNTSAPVEQGLYLWPGGSFNRAVNTLPHMTSAQKVTIADRAATLTTTDPFTGAHLDATIGYVPGAMNAGSIQNEQMNYTGVNGAGNSTPVNIYCDNSGNCTYSQ